jgi:virginiamycin A acetyltransferase
MSSVTPIPESPWRPSQGWRGWDFQRPRTIAALERIGDVLILPLAVSYRARLISFRSAAQLLSLVPGAAGVLLRRVWYRATLASCGKRLRVGFGAVIARAESRFGDDCGLGEFNHVGLVDIGSNFMSSHYVCILSGRHQHAFDSRDVPIREQPTSIDRVTIGEDVWAGARSTIAADVAPHSIVAAGSVVTTKFDPWSILGGVPAKVIGERP